MIPFQDSQRMLLVDADEQHGAVVWLRLKLTAQRFDPPDERGRAIVEMAAADTLRDLLQGEAIVSDLAPVGAREDADVPQVGGLYLDFPPLRLRRQLAQHVAA